MIWDAIAAFGVALWFLWHWFATEDAIARGDVVNASTLGFFLPFSFAVLMLTLLGVAFG